MRGDERQPYTRKKGDGRAMSSEEGPLRRLLALRGGAEKKLSQSNHKLQEQYQLKNIKHLVKAGRKEENF